jgi:hypothetical protein
MDPHQDGKPSIAAKLEKDNDQWGDKGQAKYSIYSQKRQ